MMGCEMEEDIEILKNFIKYYEADAICIAEYGNSLEIEEV